MAEFLGRGFNVASPEVDVGDDFLVLDDREGGYSRIQVKTSSTKPLKTEWGFQAQFFIPTRQLVTPHRPGLFYVLAARLDDGGEWNSETVGGTETRPVWRNRVSCDGDTGVPIPGRQWEFVVIARKSLLAKHRRNGFGILMSERVMVGLTFRRETVTGHGLDLQGFRNNFGRYWPQRDGRRGGRGTQPVS